MSERQSRGGCPQESQETTGRGLSFPHEAGAKEAQEKGAV